MQSFQTESWIGFMPLWKKLSFAKPSTLNIGIVRFVTWFTIAFVHSKRWRAMTSGMMV